jgi:hypothetical protein
MFDVAGSRGMTGHLADPCADRPVQHRKRLKVVLYNPRAVFFTMPLALLAIGSELDPDLYEGVTGDARLVRRGNDGSFAYRRGPVPRCHGTHRRPDFRRTADIACRKARAPRSSRGVGRLASVDVFS